jgi:hypothetical protein
MARRCCLASRSTTRLIAPADVAASLKLANTTVYNGTTVLGNGQSANILNLGINGMFTT